MVAKIMEDITKKSVKSSIKGAKVGNYKKLKVKNEFCISVIMENYSKESFMLLPSDFLGAFAYYVAAQNPNETFVVNYALNRFYYEIVNTAFSNVNIPQLFTYEKLEEMISEVAFVKIPAIRALNELEPDFIDLSALAKNVRFMIIRQTIVKPL